MKHYTYLPLLLAGLLIASSSCSKRKDRPDIREKEIPEVAEITYDSLKALKYGADDYGMKIFVMAFLKRGPNRDLDSARAAELQMAHLKNIQRMAGEGKLVLAGPFLGGGDLRGIYIFDVGSIEEAEELTKTDPAIQAGSLVMELKEWYGSAGLLALADIHKSLTRKSIVD